MKPICKTEKDKLHNVVKNIDAYKKLCVGCPDISKCRINEVLHHYGSNSSEWPSVEIILQNTLEMQFSSHQTRLRVKNDKSVLKRTLKEIRSISPKQSKGYNNR